MDRIFSKVWRRTLATMLWLGLAGPLFAAATTQDASSAGNAAEREDTILVFDASGSMWGQIDGVAKITIARSVVQDLLKSLPPERRLGLVAYGHRRKGDCKDIQTLVPVGTDRAAIGKAIEAINPKGMTPMTAAVQQAAEALKFTENKATVILVSDGQETCHADPCDATAALEKLGVGLTVHTIGFGLEKAEAGAADQLRCMAATTGGQFFEAHDAEELRDALSRVSVDVPAPDIEVTLKATDQVDGPEIRQGLVWTIRHGATGEVLHTSDEGGSMHVSLPPGVHEVSVKRLSDDASARGEIDTTQPSLTLPLVVEQTASVQAPASAAVGSHVKVIWEGPDEKDDYLSVAKPDDSGSSYANRTWARDGNPLNLLMPAEAGTYEVRYIQRKTNKVLAQQPIEVTPVQASVEPPASAPAGATVSVAWQGPDYTDDYLSVARADAAGHRYANRTWTRDGNPLNLLMPAEPGTYEVRYIQRQSSKILARQPIEITPVQASVEAPASASVDSIVNVTWQGPDYTDDYLSVAKPDAPGHRYESRTWTRNGNPLKLEMPSKPGTYEVRYIQRQTSKILTRQSIEVTP